MEQALVLDASAIAKWFLDEEEAPETRRIRDLHIAEKVAVYVPSLLFLEIANLLRYKEGLSAEDVVEAIEALKLLRLRVVDSTSLLPSAIIIAFKHGITVYDAVYVALAEKLGALLITYDRELLSKFPERARKASQALRELRIQ